MHFGTICMIIMMFMAHSYLHRNMHVYAVFSDCPMFTERLSVTRHEMKESVYQYTRNLQPNRSHLSKFNSSLHYARTRRQHVTSM